MYPGSAVGAPFTPVYQHLLNFFVPTTPWKLSLATRWQLFARAGHDIHWTCSMAGLLLPRGFGAFTFRKSMVDQIGTRMLDNHYFQLDTLFVMARC